MSLRLAEIVIYLIAFFLTALLIVGIMLWPS